MALILEEPTAVWLKVHQYLVKAAPLSVDVFAALQKWMMTRGNPPLRFVLFEGDRINTPQGAHPNGEQLVDVPCRVYGWFGQKPNTSDQAIVIFDDSVNDFVDQNIVASFTNAKEEQAAVYPSGLIYTTGLAGIAVADDNWTTPSNAGDAPSGFLLVGGL